MVSAWTEFVIAMMAFLVRIVQRQCAQLVTIMMLELIRVLEAVYQEHIKIYSLEVAYHVKHHAPTVSIPQLTASAVNLALGIYNTTTMAIAAVHVPAILMLVDIFAMIAMLLLIVQVVLVLQFYVLPA